MPRKGTRRREARKVKAKVFCHPRPHEHRQKAEWATQRGDWYQRQSQSLGDLRHGFRSRGRLQRGRSAARNANAAGSSRVFTGAAGEFIFKFVTLLGNSYDVMFYLQPKQTPKLPAGYVAVQALNFDRKARPGSASCPFCDHAFTGVKGVKMHLFHGCDAAKALGEFICISIILGNWTDGVFCSQGTTPPRFPRASSRPRLRQHTRRRVIRKRHVRI